MSARDIQLSKSLSWLLRHGAIREGLQISQEGYIQLPVILNHKSFKGKFNVADIERVVKNNDKQRFKLRLNPQTSTLEIKANQGHTVQIDNTDLKPILKVRVDMDLDTPTHPKEYPPNFKFLGPVQWFRLLVIDQTVIQEFYKF